MKIGTKCGFDKGQLLCSISKGLSYLEFHTNYADFSGNIDFKEIKKILDTNNVTCHAVHAPIADAFGRKETISIGTFHKELRHSNIELFKQCIQLANYLCDTKNPVVVSHIGTGYQINDTNCNNFTKYELDKVLEGAKEDLFIINKYITDNYPNTIFVVENMPTISYSENNEICSWYFGTRNDLPEFIKSLNLTNIKTCLDICHLTTTMRADKASNPYNNKTLSDYIYDYRDTIGLVHLNNCIGLGERLEFHSQPFNAENLDDVNMLTEFFNSILKFDINCPITLEINESNYLVQSNMSLTIDCIEHIFKAIHREDVLRGINFKRK